MDELDLEHEGETAHQVRRALGRTELDVVIPRVHLEESAPGVLVTEFLTGASLAEALPEDAEAVARTLIATHLAVWREAGLVLTDCRPAHVLDLGGGRVGLLGTGLARPVPRERLDAGLAAFLALRDEDPARFVAAAAALEVVPEDALPEAHTLLREIFGEFAEGPATLDGPALAAASERGFGRIRDLLRLGAGVRPAASDLAAVRMLGQLIATLSNLGVRADWFAVAEDAAA
jgi:predicted unusual protein kinase regulating ubiquinone biosynthesis (AarF/ABC1/UbiB family)